MSVILTDVTDLLLFILIAILDCPKAQRIHESEIQLAVKLQNLNQYTILASQMGYCL